MIVSAIAVVVLVVLSYYFYGESIEYYIRHWLKGRNRD